METIVWWSAGGGSLNKEVNGNHCMVEPKGGKVQIKR